MKMKTIAGKLTLLSLLFALLLAAVLYLVLDYQLTRTMSNTFADHGSTLSQALAKSVETPLVNRDLTSVQSVLDAVLSIPNVQWAYVTAPDGRVLAHTFVPQFPESLAAMQRPREGAVVPSVTTGPVKGVGIFTAPVLTGIVGRIYLALDQKALISSIHKMEILVLASILVVLLLGTISFSSLLSRIVEPVRALTHAAQQLGGDTGAALPLLQVRSDDEVGVLTGTFNRMAAEIAERRETLEERVRQRTEELSHLNEKLAQDILERKRTQEALLASEERFRGLLESAPQAVVVINSDARIVLVNAQTEQTYGYPREELLGSKVEMIVPERDRQAVAARFEARRQSPRPRAKEVGLERISRRKDGSEFPAEVNISYIEADEDFLMLSFVTDITARKHGEAELKAARDAAEAAAQAKSDFLANMSHEIRTPMNGVLGMAGLLLDTELNGEQREYTQTLRNSGEALLAIINDILDFSKIEAGKMNIEPIPFDLRVMAEETADLLASRAREKELELILRFSPQCPRRVIGDPGRVRQILLNILGNALKFTSTGHIYLNVECLERTKDGAMLRFAVEDTGIGIADEQISRIFERFSQADGSTTRKFGGTGLGLSISQRLAALMGGTMGASSVPGKGSTFWFCLRMPLDFAGPVELPRVSDLSGVRVLAVDDNATNRFVVHEQLNSWHLRNDVCESGPQALQVLREAQAAADPYHIVVLDHQMPEMSGEELARAIKADPALRETVLVMLSSHGQRGDANRMKDAGFAAYLTKPVRQSQLFDALAASWATRTRGKRLQLITRHTLAESSAAPPQPPAQTEVVIHARILLVEDNAVNQKVAVRMLEKLGCRVDVAANGSEALHMLELLPYDLVFMDCQMPVMDGYEATREIRRREGQRAHQFVVAMTANAMQGDREKCLEAGMDDYISKPISKNDLIKALDRHLEAKNSSDLMQSADSGKESS